MFSTKKKKTPESTFYDLLSTPGASVGVLSHSLCIRTPQEVTVATTQEVEQCITRTGTIKQQLSNIMNMIARQLEEIFKII